MDTKYIFRTALLSSVLLAAASCIYPFEPELPSVTEAPLVVEGDIHIGGQTTLRLSHVKSFYETESSTSSIYVRGHIEGEDGTTVQGQGFIVPGGINLPYGDGVYSDGVNQLWFDTADLRPDQRYRLQFSTFTQGGDVLNSFESDWLQPAPAPTIDGLSYSLHEELDQLWIGLTMHGNGSKYFRWTFSEVWEYHSDINSNFEYHPESRTITSNFDKPTLYYCWSRYNSPQINIFSTANQTEDRFEELAFHRIGRTDKRLQVLYHITVRLEGMTEDAYNYWNNIQQGSEGQGSIFSPTPSEMASNIRCVTDPGLQVIGYLNASVQAEADMYYDNQQVGFYKASSSRNIRDDQKVPVNRPDSMAYWYARSYLPYSAIYEGLSDAPSHYMWTPKPCIDCRMQGGSKNKPEGWPNDHR